MSEFLPDCRRTLGLRLSPTVKRRTTIPSWAKEAMGPSGVTTLSKLGPSKIPVIMYPIIKGCLSRDTIADKSRPTPTIMAS